MDVKKSVLIFFLCLAVPGMFFSCKTIFKTVTEHDDELHAEDKTEFSGVNKKLDKLLNPPPPVLPKYPEGSRIVPVSTEIIERTKADNLDISKLDYYLSANISVFVNNTDDKLELKDGKLVETKINQTEEVPITIANSGEMVGGGRDFFEVSFTGEGDGEGIILRFEKNNIRNRFDLVSANKRGKNYALNFENERPYLVIDYPYKPNEESIQVQGVNASVSANIPSVSKPAPPPPSSVGKQPPSPPPSYLPPPVMISCNAERIEGKGTLTHEATVRFIREMNQTYPQSFLEEFIGAYFREAESLGINPDIAIAQMFYVTKFLKNDKVMKTGNFAGFRTMPEGGCFYNLEEGVKAHIQHLKGYASTDYNPSNIVDPRWEYLTNLRGSVKNLEDLARMWAPYNSNYAEEIAKIILQMRLYAQLNS